MFFVVVEGFFMHLCAKIAQLFQYLHRVLDRCCGAAAAVLWSVNTYLQSRKFSRRHSPAKTQGPAPVFLVLWNANVTSVAVLIVPSYFEARTHTQTTHTQTHSALEASFIPVKCAPSFLCGVPLRLPFRWNRGKAGAEGVELCIQPIIFHEC